jgi:hypothetical protein
MDLILVIESFFGVFKRILDGIELLLEEIDFLVVVMWKISKPGPY